MCGIAGWFGSHPLQAGPATAVLGRMLDSIRHRGPDGEGQDISANAALGHVRLSIIDIAGGRQPLASPDGSCLLVFNGEIYNYRDLRRTLLGLGYPFQTESDSEVILAVYQHYGVEGFSRLRGMFAFALWDKQSNTGYLARDACGIKPLFHAQDAKGRVLFGSEAKAILASGCIKAVLDENHLHQVMNFRYLPGEGSLFKGIHQVAPGQVLQWTLQHGLRAVHTLHVAPAAETTILETLRDSVHNHLVADVEVGIHLSGGVDSAAILALACREHNLRTFTMAIGDDAQESVNAAETARLFNAPNICEPVSFDLPALLPRIVWHMEMPKVNALQVYLLSGLSARHVKVVLSGMGGDELFYGYNVFRILWMLQQVRMITKPLRSNAPFNGFRSSLLSGQYEWNEYDRMRAMLQHGGNWSFVYGLVRNVWDCPAHRRWIYGPRMLDSHLDDSFAVLEERWPKEPDPIAAAARFEWNNKLVNDLLWQEDRCSMAHGLESRVPFVDAVVAQRMQGYSRQELMPGGKLKGRLRQELAGVLPAAVLNRKKSGFQVDSPSFFHSHLGPLAEEYLAPGKVRDYGLFNPDFVRFLLNLPASKRYRWHYFMLYLMISSHLWLELFENDSTSLLSAPGRPR
jgi:asparagine synthase (glutamine-hydrolysing)